VRQKSVSRKVSKCCGRKKLFSCCRSNSQKTYKVVGLVCCLMTDPGMSSSVCIEVVAYGDVPDPSNKAFEVLICRISKLSVLED